MELTKKQLEYLRTCLNFHYSESDHFGRHFFIDSSFEFLSAPSFIYGGYDESQLDYVSNWTDLEGVNLSKLFGIYRTLVQREHNEIMERSQ